MVAEGDAAVIRSHDMVHLTDHTRSRYTAHRRGEAGRTRNSHQLDSPTMRWGLHSRSDLYQGPSTHLVLCTVLLRTLGHQMEDSWGALSLALFHL